MAKREISSTLKNLKVIYQSDFKRFPIFPPLLSFSPATLGFDLGFALIYLRFLSLDEFYFCFVEHTQLTSNLYVCWCGNLFLVIVSTKLLFHSLCKGQLRERKRLRNKKRKSQMRISFPLVSLGSGNVPYISFASWMLSWFQFCLPQFFSVFPFSLDCIIAYIRMEYGLSFLWYYSLE